MGWEVLDHLSPSFEEIGYFEFFGRDVIGQLRAKEKLAKKMAAWKHGLRDTMKPAGVLCFLGPSGVGKTFLVRVFAKLLFGNPDGFVRIDCSTYQEKHSISRLIGSPPGYVGFDGEPELSQKKLDHHGLKAIEERNKKKEKEKPKPSPAEIKKERERLEKIAEKIEACNKRIDEILYEIEIITDEIKRNPQMSDRDKNNHGEEILALINEGDKLDKELKDLLKQSRENPEEKEKETLPPSIILFDEIEKMHPEITKSLLPMLDSGIVPLANGDRINFRNCFVFMTSNIGSERIARTLSGKRGPIGFGTNSKEKAKKTDPTKKFYDIVMEEIDSSKHFPPELIGRIGKENFVVFHPLEEPEVRRIINNQLAIVVSRFKKVLKNIEIEFSDSLHSYIFQETQDPVNKSLGARPIENVISAKISPALINLVIKGENGGIVNGDKIRLSVNKQQDDGKNKNLLVVEKFTPDPIEETEKEPVIVA